MLTSLVLATALTLAADNRQMRTVEALVHIDKGGKVQQLDWLHPEQVSDSISTYLKPQVLAVDFDPATKNGQATYTELLINVLIETAERADGLSDVRFVTIEKAGPKIINMPTPHYPTQMMKRGTSAYVVLSVEIGPDGRVIAESIALTGETPDKDSVKVKQFFRSASLAVRNMQFGYLENVGGVKIGGQITVPFTFCINSCDAINAEVAKIRAAQVLVPSASTDVKLASIKQNSASKAITGS